MNDELVQVNSFAGDPPTDPRPYNCPLRGAGDATVYGLVMEREGYLIVGSTVDTGKPQSDIFGCALNEELARMEELIAVQGGATADNKSGTNAIIGTERKCGRCGVAFTLCATPLDQLEPTKKEIVLDPSNPHNLLTLESVFWDIHDHIS